MSIITAAKSGYIFKYVDENPIQSLLLQAFLSARDSSGGRTETFPRVVSLAWGVPCHCQNIGDLQ